MSADQPERRRAADRRKGYDRRSSEIRRPLTPPWPEQRPQFLTRYLFWALGLAYFSLNPSSQIFPSPAFINLSYAIYVVLNTAFMIHARRHPDSQARWRAAMWVDIIFVSICFAGDRSSAIPPAFMAYLAVILGNGMRYSMKFFREAVGGSFIAGLIAMYLRYSGDLHVVNLGTAFVIMFGGIVILYSYSLMKRVEEGRERLEREGRIDPLTGLLNRRGLYEQAEPLFAALGRNITHLSVLFADVNKFKAINDRLGHQEGDVVLTQLAALLSNNIRGSDILARYGGDEFVLILPGSDLIHADVVARRLQKSVARWVTERGIDLSLSVGIAEAPRHGAHLDTVLHNVDKAMYRGKDRPGCIEQADDLPDMPPAVAT